MICLLKELAVKDIGVLNSIFWAVRCEGLDIYLGWNPFSNYFPKLQVFGGTAEGFCSHLCCRWSNILLYRQQRVWHVSGSAPVGHLYIIKTGSVLRLILWEPLTWPRYGDEVSPSSATHCVRPNRQALIQLRVYDVDVAYKALFKLCEKVEPINHKRASYLVEISTYTAITSRWGIGWSSCVLMETVLKLRVFLKASLPDIDVTMSPWYKPFIFWITFPLVVYWWLIKKECAKQAKFCKTFLWTACLKQYNVLQIVMCKSRSDSSKDAN